MKALLLNGWAIDSRVAAALLPCSPGVELEVVQPTPDWRERAAAADASVLIGYSTGAFLALSAPELLEQFERVVFFAPFADFKAEAQRGGRVQTVQLKYLLRQLRQEPLAAVVDFYERAGLRNPPPADLPAPADQLKWGIERLLHDHVDGAWIEKSESYVGANDRLLDAERLAGLYPSITILEHAGHDLGELAAAAGFTL